jgi:hypothetical protein
VVAAPDQFEFSYTFHPLPPGRLGFRRWRWELWHGPALVAAGWRLSPQHAESALRTAASRLAHRLLGVHVLHPERTTAISGFAPDGAVHVDCGAVACRLVPRAQRVEVRAAAG